MTRALLDHPWGLEEVMNAASPAHNALLDFEKLVRRHGLAVVPFVDDEEHSRVLRQLRGRTAGAAAARRFFAQCARRASDGPMATPVTGTELRLSTTWRQALRDEMRDPNDWRAPQIVVPKKRSGDWPDAPEVEVRCEDSLDSQPGRKTLVRLEGYHEHPHAMSDLDPWACLEGLYKPEPSARIQHPCVLPKPPCLERVSADMLAETVAHARALGWVQNDCYFYIPPPDHDFNAVTKEEWRRGRAFPWVRHDGLQGPRLRDTNGVVWIWDRNERHWDVQLPNYIRVSHDGRKLT